MFDDPKMPGNGPTTSKTNGDEHEAAENAKAKADPEYVQRYQSIPKAAMAVAADAARLALNLGVLSQRVTDENNLVVELIKRRDQLADLLSEALDRMDRQEERHAAQVGELEDQVRGHLATIQRGSADNERLKAQIDEVRGRKDLELERCRMSYQDFKGELCAALDILSTSSVPEIVAAVCTAVRQRSALHAEVEELKRSQATFQVQAGRRGG